MTDKRDQGAPDVSDEHATTRPQPVPDRDAEDLPLNEAPVATLRDEPDGTHTVVEAPEQAGDLPAADTVAVTDDESPADDGRRRPPLPIIIGSVLLLVAIGAGLAFLIPSGPIREVDQLVPTADPSIAATEAASAPTAPPLPAAVEGDADEVIAQVGEGQILRGDFVRFYQPGASAEELLDQLIQRELVIQAGLDEGVVVDDAQVTAQLEEIKASQGGGDEAQFQAFLDQANIGSEENLRRLLGHDQIIEAMILRHTTGEQAHARHILLSTQSISDTATVRSEAEDLLAQLEDGADFAALATENSDDPGSAANGGDLGWALRGMYVSAFDEAVFSMEPGELRLVETEYGFHIIELLEPTEVRGLDDSSMLQTGPGQQAFAETFIPWVDQLKQEAEASEQIQILVPVDQLVAMPDAPAP